MMTRYAAVFASSLFAAVWFNGSTVQALTMQECSAKYKAAQTDGSAKGVKWADFRKANCGTDAAPAATPAAAAGNAVFPTAINPKYAKETHGQGRKKTCLDQYNANKANNANGGLKWLQKGGGYYSQCNNRLKGTA